MHNQETQNSIFICYTLVYWCLTQWPQTSEYWPIYDTLQVPGCHGWFEHIREGISIISNPNHPDRWKNVILKTSIAARMRQISRKPSLLMQIWFFSKTEPNSDLFPWSRSSHGARSSECEAFVSDGLSVVSRR